MSEKKTVEKPTIEEEIKGLIEQGKLKGFLTYEELNDFLPDDVVSPEYIDEILLTLDEKGIELVDERDLEEEEGGEILLAEEEEPEEPEAAEEEEEGAAVSIDGSTGLVYSGSCESVFWER